MKPITSPGIATSKRVGIELDYTSEIRAATRTFLFLVENDAIAALSSPVLLAAGTPPEPFSLGKVLLRWERVTQRLMARIATTLGLAGDHAAVDTYLAQVEMRLTRSALPAQVYDSVRTVLAQSLAESWDHHVTHAALAHALSADTAAVSATVDGLTTTGHTWSTIAERIARTEATAAFGHASLDTLARNPHHTAKRWVSHHDSLVRPSHLEANGQTVLITAPFIVGGYALMHPGDPSAPAAETYNCRCVLVGVR